MDNKKKKQLKWQLPFLILLIIGTALIIRQQQSMPYQHDSGFVFGTVYNITYQSDKNLKKEIENELKKVDASLSMFNKNSVISRINRNEAVVPDKMFLEVFDLAQSVSKETNGAFDITVAPLVNVWGFGFKNGTPPTTHSIDSLRRFVDYRPAYHGGLQRDSERLRLRRDSALFPFARHKEFHDRDRWRDCNTGL